MTASAAGNPTRAAGDSDTPAKSASPATASLSPEDLGELGARIEKQPARLAPRIPLGRSFLLPDGGFPLLALGAGIGGLAIIGSGGYFAWRRRQAQSGVTS